MPPVNRFSYVQAGAPSEDACLIKVWISAVSTKKNVTFYTISVKSAVGAGETWKVHRRYSEFLTLRDRLLAHFEETTRKCPGCVTFQTLLDKFEFPRKHMFSSRSQVVIRYRAKALRSFIRLVAGRMFTHAPKCPSCSGIPFQQAKAFLVRDAEILGDSTVNDIRQSIVAEHMMGGGGHHPRKHHTSSTYDFSCFYTGSDGSSSRTTQVLEISEPATSAASSDRARSMSPSKRTRNGKQRAPVIRSFSNDSDDAEDGINLDFDKTLKVRSSPRQSQMAASGTGGGRSSTAHLNHLWQPWEMVSPE